MKRIFTVWLCASLLAVFMAGCGVVAERSDAPPAVTSCDVITEPVVHDFCEKPGSETQFVASYPVGTTVRYDLNGDGIGEDISVRTHEFEAGRLTIGDVFLEIWSCTPTGYFTVVNVDNSDDRLLVGISDYGASDDPETVFYAYDGMHVREIGYLSDILGRNVYGYEGAVCHGDGTVTARKRWDVLGTWNTVGLYRVKENEIEDITSFYPFVDWEGNESAWGVTAKCGIVMYEEEDSETTMMIPGGSPLNMMGLRRGVDDHTFWVLFEAPEQGKKLWLKIERIEWPSCLETDRGFVSSEEAFDGFFYAG